MNRSLKHAMYDETIPQYTSALGGFLGAMAAQKHLPPKYRTVGQIAGTIAGTGVGIESGGAAARTLDRFSPQDKVAAAEELLKLALPDPPPDSGEPPAPENAQLPAHPGWQAARAVGGGLLAFGAGTAAGYGLQHGAHKLLGDKITPAHAHAIIPVLGGVAGLAYNQYKSREAQELRNALETYKNQRAGAVPAE